MVEEYLKLVNRYINGEDINDYSVIDLENDPEFMARVLYVSKDPKMYQFASERVKRSFMFVSRVLNAFRDNYTFCQKVADYFISTSQNDEEIEDITVEMINIARHNHDIYNKYAISVSINYAALLMETEISKNRSDSQYKGVIGEGYIFIKNKYKNRPKTLNFYTLRFFNDILDKYNIDICCLIKESFKDASEAQSYGTIRFISETIGKYDYSLGEYIKSAPHVLVDVLKDVDKLYKNWDRFFDRKENAIYNAMLGEIETYLKSEESHLMPDDYVIFKAASSLGILDKIKNYMLVPYTDEEIDEAMTFVKENDMNYSKDDFLTIAEVCAIMNRYLHPEKKSETPVPAGSTARS